MELSLARASWFIEELIEKNQKNSYNLKNRRYISLGTSDGVKEFGCGERDKRSKT